LLLISLFRQNEPSFFLKWRLWKYLLGLELTDSGFDASVLSEFRARLIDRHAEERLLEKMLTLCATEGLAQGTRTTAH
jgi:transposase